MARKPARFRISIKDLVARETIKIELIPSDRWLEQRRFFVWVNNRMSTKVETVTLTQSFHRLRRWLVKRDARIKS
jgi:hypothetical protein